MVSAKLCPHCADFNLFGFLSVRFYLPRTQSSFQVNSFINDICYSQNERKMNVDLSNR
ncbi:conserved hypothetical protein [Vibrio harveyi]|nr:hypothetical protein VCHENC01_1084 [Vibrio harveyi]CAH1202647.1 conserved hypothetical protein [Vibrio harveyi]CAH1528518.1 conserved hypothetical protein [Vibrio harveyi]CAH1547783.1 conserved hypothetical protein [Vibrio harveyi]CAH1549716.1 conserved hypothetical protein [Vibrio harveyi]